MTAQTADEGTSFYTCDKCGKACDPVYKSIPYVTDQNNPTVKSYVKALKKGGWTKEKPATVKDVVNLDDLGLVNTFDSKKFLEAAKALEDVDLPGEHTLIDERDFLILAKKVAKYLKEEGQDEVVGFEGRCDSFSDHIFRDWCLNDDEWVGRYCSWE